MWVTKLLISPVKIRIFAQKSPNLARKWHFCSFWARPCWLIWCPVVSCGARVLSRKTTIYFIILPVMGPADDPLCYPFWRCLRAHRGRALQVLSLLVIFLIVLINIIVADLRTKNEDNTLGKGGMWGLRVLLGFLKFFCLKTI